MLHTREECVSQADVSSIDRSRDGPTPTKPSLFSMIRHTLCCDTFAAACLANGGRKDHIINIDGVQ